MLESIWGKGDHFIFTTGLNDIPLVNIQPNKNNKAKGYQVEQVLKAIQLKDSIGEK